MRRVDRWCGVPICFVLTIWRRLTEGMRRAAVPAAPKQVLFIQTAEMGSLVLAMPAVQHIERAYPGCKVYLLVFANLADAVTTIGLAPAERVLTIDSSSLFSLARDTWRVLRQIRRKRIDTAINLEMFARFGSILTFLSGASRRAGFHAFGHPGLYCGDLLTHRVIYNPHVHTSEALLTIARALGEDPGHVPMGKIERVRGFEGSRVRGFGFGSEGPSGRVVTDDSTRQRVLERLASDRSAVRGKRLVVVNPNASQLIPIRRWPIESYADLVGKLLADPDVAIVLTGTAAEQWDTRFIADRVRSDRIVDLAGKTTIRELLDLYNVADLLITNDSGPAQLAALTSVHIVVFFGPETPALYQPLAEAGRCTVLYSHYACSPCVSAFNQRTTSCDDNICLKAIGVAQVHEVAAAILTKRKAG